MKKNLMPLLAVLLVLTFLFVGCGAAGTDTTNDTASAVTEPAQTSDDAPQTTDDTAPATEEQSAQEAAAPDPAADGEVTLEEAKALVLADLGIQDTKFYDVELDKGVYELEVILDGTQYSYKIDAATGQILHVEQERAEADDINDCENDAHAWNCPGTYDDCQLDCNNDTHGPNCPGTYDDCHVDVDLDD